MIPPDIFVKNILVKKLNAGWIVIGDDFYFGRHRQAGVNFLEKAGREFGFVVKRIGTLKYKGIAISSSLIRRSILNGKIKFAEKLLGRPATILGTVVKGIKRGRIIGFPTANINPHHEVVPPSGVYLVKVKIDKNQYDGLLNIGLRPAFYGIDKQDKEPMIEVHIFNFSKNIYGKDIEVEFIKKIRSEKRFSSEEALRKQIIKDAKTVLT